MFSTSRSETIAKIAPALLRAQRKIDSAKKESINPHFKSKFADLGSVIDSCKEQLNDEGIVILQPPGFDAEGQFVETVLLHESGEWISSKMRVVMVKQDMQGMGSGVSYARRYSLQSIVNLYAEDDDGNAASNPGKTPPPLPKTEGSVQAPKRAAGGFGLPSKTTPKPKTEETKSAPGEGWGE